MQEPFDQGQTVSRKGPGEFLRKARGRLGLEPENVAQMLHLSPQQIEAIEADDFDQLPEPTYVRGYLRSYSQLVSVDPEAVIKTYNDAIGGWKTATYSGLATEKQVTSKDNVVRFATIGVIGIVIGLAVVWWLGEEETPAVVPAPTEVAAVPTAPEETKPAGPAEGLVEPEAEKAEASAVPTAPEPVAPAATADEASAVELEPTPQPAELAKPAAAQPPMPTTPVAEVKKPAPEIDVPAGTRSKLVLRTRGASWADIRDADDNKLLYETVAAGREITIEGESPIHVFLGNADAVSVEFNGVDYDFSSHKNGLTARFVLGKTRSADGVGDNP